MLRLRRGCGAIVLLLAAMTGVEPTAAQAPSSEAEAMVRFTLTLARFVQWPDGPAAPGAPLRLCLLQNSRAVEAAFVSRKGTTVTGRPLEVLNGAAVKGAACDLLFVDASAGSAGMEALAASAPALTIGSADGFLSRGGMVELVNVNDALRFDVHMKPLRQAGLSLSAQALKLARHVQE
ncbi:MAG: YfiR family protein [Piscinibacter sp.]